MQINNLSASLIGILNQSNQINQSRQITMVKIATGDRINRAANDPAGLIASEHLRSAIASLDAESRSLQRTSHVANTADAALGEMSDQLIEARAANVAMANSAGMSESEREAYQMQINYAVQTVDRIARQANFAGTPTLDGNMTLKASGDSLTIPKSDPTELGEVTQGSQTARLSDIGSNAMVNDHAFSEAVLDDAFSQLLTQRAEIGAFNKYTIQSRENAIQVEIENTVAAESRIRDTDYAKETSALVRDNIKNQATMHALKVDSELRNSMMDLIV